MNGFFRIGNECFNIAHVIRIHLAENKGQSHIIYLSFGYSVAFDEDSEEGRALVKFVSGEL